MAKNRFAQPLYGKIIYIYETNLTMEQLPTIFDPSTYWIDVTGLDCEVGYLVGFKEGVGLVLAPPPNEEYTFEELKAQKLELVGARTADKITGGFISSCSGEPVQYDSDEATQSTMQTMYAATKSLDFTTHPDYQGVIPVRGYAEGSTIKTVFYLTAPQVQKFMDDLALHIGKCKQAGWEKQALVEAALSKEDLDAIILD